MFYLVDVALDFGQIIVGLDRRIKGTLLAVAGLAIAQ
jgi:hypothetical protein